AAREPQDRALVRGRKTRGTAPDPILLFLCGQRIEIEQDLPGRLLGEKALKTRAPPEAARIVGIFPKVVERAAAAPDERDVVGAVIDRRERVAVRRESRVPESRKRALILLVHPGERAPVVDLFEPEVRIIVRRRKRRPCIYCHAKWAPSLSQKSAVDR